MTRALLKNVLDWCAYKEHMKALSYIVNCEANWKDGTEPLSYPCLLIWYSEYSDSPYSSGKPRSITYDFIYPRELEISK